MAEKDLTPAKDKLPINKGIKKEYYYEQKN